MLRIARIARGLPGVVMCVAMTGCQGPAPKPHDGTPPVVGDNLMHPLRFHRHAFEPHCYNTLRCEVVYGNFRFYGPRANRPRPAPPAGDYRADWSYASFAGVRNFPAPARVEWTSLDGTAHVADVDIGAIFRDERVLHRVPEEDIPENSWGGEPGIHLEVNDRTVSVYMQAIVSTRTEQVPGNQYSHHRADVILAWTHTY